MKSHAKKKKAREKERTGTAQKRLKRPAGHCLRLELSLVVREPGPCFRKQPQTGSTRIKTGDGGFTGSLRGGKETTFHKCEKR